MCYVTATELKNNLSFYLSKSTQEDVYVTKNGNVIACLTNPKFKALVELDEILSSIETKEVSTSDDKALQDELIKKHL
ncbi:MAG: type II toxin-antitoxin system prevent-host-death family antitoxin [Bacilli bacterium]|nr:type II toxin-antitoxin system prevent-host-death family antitoxin [Bacilli bacterium]